MRKELYEEYFKDKKVTVLGLGLLGRGLGDTEFLLTHGADVICTDTRSKEKLAGSISSITKNSPQNLQLVIGENRFADFENRDYILTCAGMQKEYEYLVHAKSHAIPVYMSAALVSHIIMEKLEGVTIVGVTGTRGKSTVTQLVAHILKSGGMRVHLGGNVRGVATLPLLETVEEGDFLVLELDSWQLQGFGDMHISPNIAVFTSFLDDHMNYYKNDKESYFSDKANIYRYQNEYDVLIASPQAASEIMLRDKKANPVVPDGEYFEMKLIGEHNQVAARLAYEVGIQCGLDEATIKEAIRTFEAVEGRLQDLGIFSDKRVHVFNDNNATTPDATIAALRAVNETYHKKPILILGGSDKGLSLVSLEDEVTAMTKAAIFLEGTGTSKLSLQKEYQFSRLMDCVDKAFSLAEEGDIILFSPAFASFSSFFNNEYEKNDAFMEALIKYR